MLVILTYCRLGTVITGTIYTVCTVHKTVTYLCKCIYLYKNWIKLDRLWLVCNKIHIWPKFTALVLKFVSQWEAGHILALTLCIWLGSISNLQPTDYFVCLFVFFSSKKKRDGVIKRFFKPLLGIYYKICVVLFYNFPQFLILFEFTVLLLSVETLCVFYFHIVLVLVTQNKQEMQHFLQEICNLFVNWWFIVVTSLLLIYTYIYTY